MPQAYLPVLLLYSGPSLSLACKAEIRLGECTAKVSVQYNINMYIRTVRHTCVIQQLSSGQNGCEVCVYACVRACVCVSVYVRVYVYVTVCVCACVSFMWWTIELVACAILWLPRVPFLHTFGMCTHTKCYICTYMYSPPLLHRL